MTVGHIAFGSGFKNTTHFVKVFKDAYGMPPLQYRLKNARVAAK
jgi:AraC-like DNA-binding protein